MKIAVVNLSSHQALHSLSEIIALTVKTTVKDTMTFDKTQEIDLLLIGIQGDDYLHQKQIKSFIQSLNRHYIHNIAFYSTYKFPKKVLNNALKEAGNNHLPLMRDIFECQLKLLQKDVSEVSKSLVRSYCEDMMMIVDKYY